MDEHKLVPIKSLGNIYEAELAVGALKNEEIEAMIQADSVGHMREHIAFTGAGFKILVREEDSAAAIKILDSAEAALDNADDERRV
jgi:hypothetical protein